METKKILYGYIDNIHIANGFLIPIYCNSSDEYYFHELKSDNKTTDYKFIKTFKKFENDSYKTDKVTKIKFDSLKKVIVDENDEPYFVVKVNNSIYWDSYSGILSFLAQEIIENKITSKTLINTAQKIFGEDLKSELKRKASIILSSVRGVSKVRISEYLKEVNTPRLFKIIEGNDNKFSIFYQELVVSRNKRVIEIPHNITLEFPANKKKLIFKSHESKYVFDRYFDDLLKIELNDYFEIDENVNKKVWRFKLSSKDDFEPVYLVSEFTDQMTVILFSSLNTFFSSITKTNSYVKQRNQHRFWNPKKAVRTR